ncbi:MAG: hypothetical protein RLN60_03265 [Phycisphaerales bacterium]
MNKSTLTAAEATDRHGRLLMLAITLASLASFLNAAEDLTSGTVEDYIKYSQLVVIAVMFAMMFPVANWKFRISRRLSSEDRQGYFADDSFMVDALKRGKSASWIVALVLFMVMAPISRTYDELPAEFFFHIAFGVMLGVFGVSALVLARDPSPAPDA